MNLPSLSPSGQAIPLRSWTASDAVARLLSVRRLWFPATLLVVGVYAGLPWLAPVFMRLGWTAPAQVIYDIYSTQCHQLAQRSYFLFGSKIMYAPSELEIPDATAGFLALRAFRGAPGIGWKVAWSDRMTAMYSGLFVFMIVARLLRHRLTPLPVWAFLLLIVPRGARRRDPPAQRYGRLRSWIP